MMIGEIVKGLAWDKRLFQKIQFQALSCSSISRGPRPPVRVESLARKGGMGVGGGGRVGDRSVRGTVDRRRCAISRGSEAISLEICAARATLRSALAKPRHVCGPPHSQAGERRRRGGGGGSHRARHGQGGGANCVHSTVTHEAGPAAPRDRENAHRAPRAHPCSPPPLPSRTLSHSISPPPPPSSPPPPPRRRNGTSRRKKHVDARVHDPRSRRLRLGRLRRDDGRNGHDDAQTPSLRVRPRPRSRSPSPRPPLSRTAARSRARTTRTCSLAIASRHVRRDPGVGRHRVRRDLHQGRRIHCRGRDVPRRLHLVRHDLEPRGQLRDRCRRRLVRLDRSGT